MTHDDESDDYSADRERRTGELVDRVATGDSTAREELLMQELPRLRAFIRLRAGAALRAQESASDLVQSVCREVLSHLGDIEFRGAAAFRRWLYLAAEHKIVDRARRLGAQRHNGGSAADEGCSDLRRTYASLLTPSRIAGAREEVERLENAVAKLSPDHREVITLAKIVGLSHKEIGETMRRTEGAARVLLFRALAELSERLRES